MAGSVTSVDLSTRDSTRLDTRRLEAVRLESRALRQMSAEVRVRVRTNRDKARQGRSRHETLRDSAFARLFSRYQTMQVIEQAKGIIMAQQRCGPDEAFELLRRASEWNNVKLHVLAAQIIEHVASPHHGSDGTLISLGVMRCLLAGTRAGPPAR